MDGFFFSKDLRSVNLLFTKYVLISLLPWNSVFSRILILGHWSFGFSWMVGIRSSIHWWVGGGAGWGVGNGRVNPWCHLREKNNSTGQPFHFSWSRPNIDGWIYPLVIEGTIEELPAGICILGGPWSQRPWILKRGKWKIEIYVRFFCRL